MSEVLLGPSLHLRGLGGWWVCSSASVGGILGWEELWKKSCGHSCLWEKGWGWWHVGWWGEDPFVFPLNHHCFPRLSSDLG